MLELYVRAAERINAARWPSLAKNRAADLISLIPGWQRVTQLAAKPDILIKMYAEEP